MPTDPDDAAASRAALDAWRARPHAEQLAGLAGGAPAAARRRPTVAEALALQVLVRDCPHRVPPACGCPQVPATCARPDRAGLEVWRDECEACVGG